MNLRKLRSKDEKFPSYEHIEMNEVAADDVWLEQIMVDEVNDVGLEEMVDEAATMNVKRKLDLGGADDPRCDMHEAEADEAALLSQLGDDSGDESDEDFVPEEEVLSEAEGSDIEVSEEVVNERVGKEIIKSFSRLASLVPLTVGTRAALDAEDNDSLHSVDNSDSEEEVQQREKGKSKRKFPEFNSDLDMSNPKFEGGLLFASHEVFKEAVKQYARMNRVDLMFPVNDKLRMRVICEKGCPFYIWASQFDSKDPKDESWQIKILTEEHTCKRSSKNHHVTAKFMADWYLKKFQVDPKYSIMSLQDDVLQEFRIEVSLTKCSRAKKRANELVAGNYTAQYGRIYDYLSEVRDSNPGSTTIVKLEDNYFQRMYICLEALKRGWKSHCRPIICLDGCFLKGYYHGHLLSAVGLDADDCIYPIAWAFVESENTQSWTWFLEILKDDLGLGGNFNIVWMSDRQKGLVEAIVDLFPGTEHRFCMRHIYSNFKLNPSFKGKIMKDAVWKASKATYVSEWKATMEQLKVKSKDAYDWLAKIDPKQWSKAFFSSRAKSDIVCNNHSESFNKFILDARELPILTCFETIRSQVMLRIAKKKEETEKYQGTLCPKVQKKLNSIIDASYGCNPRHAGGHKFQVTCGPQNQHVVDMDKRVCTCCKWDLTGIPCKHAVAVLRTTNENPEEFVDVCYYKDTQLALYSNFIVPIRGPNQWNEGVYATVIKPPITRRPVGRPAKNRKRGPDEPVKVTRVGKFIFHQTCGKCNKKGHNSRTCRGVVGGNPQIPKKKKNNPSSTAGTSSAASPTVAAPTTVPAAANVSAVTTISAAATYAPRRSKLPFKRPSRVTTPQESVAQPPKTKPVPKRKVVANRVLSQPQSSTAGTRIAEWLMPQSQP